MKQFSRRLLGIALVSLILAACAAVPVYKPLSPRIGVVCPDIFPSKTFRAVHQISMSSALVGKSQFIGAVKGEPARDALHAVLMSVEGMVLFEAVLETEELRIISAFPPLNDPAFAKGLMADVSFLLLKPPGAPAEMGADQQGFAACRWPTVAGGLIEQAVMKDGAVRIRRYDPGKRATGEALVWPPFDRGLPAKMRLKSVFPAPYTIDLTLMEMEFVDEEATP
jgi:hypothetical protein